MNPTPTHYRPSRLWLTATGALAVASLLFGVSCWQISCGGGGGWQALKAFAEAAMVGGLADWFAVVALFRHPLGLPIPHTAVLQRSQERLANSIASFFRSSFWVPQQIRARVAEVAPTRALVRAALGAQGAGERLQHCVKEELLPLLRDEAICRALAQVLQQALQGVPLEHFARTAAGSVAQSKLPESAVTLLLEEGSSYLATHRTELEIRLGQTMAAKGAALLGGGMGGFLDPFIRTALAPMVIQESTAYLKQLADAPHSPLRVNIHARLSTMLQQIADGQRGSKELGYFRETLTDAETLCGALQHIPEFLAASPRFSQAEADSWLPALQHFLELHPPVAQALDTLLADLAADVTERTAPMVEQELKRTIMSWDMATMTERLEMQVGDDLQFIRLNGTLVGGLIGLCIFGITRLMGMI